MKPSFHSKLLNGPFEDPGIYIRLLREGRALMFDLGSTLNLSPRDILKITDIFVTHSHIDHFIGFDNVLRVSLKRESPLRIYGPKGFIDCVKGKLESYTWNLISDYPLRIDVSEVTETSIKKAAFRAKNRFRPEDSGIEPFNGTLLEDPLFKVSAEILDHQIPCLAFSIKENYHINIDKAKLSRLNLPVGPWLGELKSAIREKRTEDTFKIEGNTFTYSELRGIAGITEGQKISYVVDVIGSTGNKKKIIELVKGSDILYIETFFLQEDIDRAKNRYHLTAKEAGSIAREANVGRMEAIHFSSRYMGKAERLVREAEEEFKKTV
jgi:ribonuclease Z